MDDLFTAMSADMLEAPNEDDVVAAARILGDHLTEVGVPFSRLLTKGNLSFTAYPDAVGVRWGNEAVARMDAVADRLVVMGSVPNVPFGDDDYKEPVAYVYEAFAARRRHFRQRRLHAVEAALTGGVRTYAAESGRLLHVLGGYQDGFIDAVRVVRRESPLVVVTAGTGLNVYFVNV